MSWEMPKSIEIAELKFGIISKMMQARKLKKEAEYYRHKMVEVSEAISKLEEYKNTIRNQLKECTDLMLKVNTEFDDLRKQLVWKIADPCLIEIDQLFLVQQIMED